ncbi:hypothetical protein JHK86_035500 [Glycine max]|nr:hypothetical protein JHK86_035500 [Glycine max]
MLVKWNESHVLGLVSICCCHNMKLYVINNVFGSCLYGDCIMCLCIVALQV